MPAVRTLFADPHAIRVDGEHGTWLLSGVATNRLRDIVVDARGIEDVTAQLSTQTEDAVVVFVAGTDRGGRVEAFRSVTASRDLFYLQASDGTLVVTDHYRNAVSQLSPGDRSLNRTAIVDHLLFRSPVDPETYIEEIGRLGRGERLGWDGENQAWTREIVDTLPSPDRFDATTGVDALDEGLSDMLQIGARPDARTMLSGGIDSTLLASYRDHPPPAVQVTLDSPEFQHEVEAGQAAAEYLDRSLETVSLSEAAILDQVETAVDRLGLPPRYSQSVFTAAAFQSMAPGQYVNGQAADALFGLPGVKAGRLASWLGRIGTIGSSVLPDRFADGATAIRQRHEQLQRELAHPQSFVHAVSADVDAASVASIFDASMVRRRAQRRLEYALNRATLTADSGFARHAAAGHLVDFMDDDGVNQWRQVGFSGGQDVFAPFRTRRVAAAALGVPANQRYVQGWKQLPSITTKHIPKQLVAKRVPEYPVHQQKGSGALPIARYFRTGGLQDVFDQYEPPAFLSDEARINHIDEYGSLTWELLTFSIWRDRIFYGRDLPLVDGTDVKYLRLAIEPAAPPT